MFLGTDSVGRSALIGSLNLEQEVAGALFTAVVTVFLQANTCSYNHTHTDTEQKQEHRISFSLKQLSSNSDAEGVGDTTGSEQQPFITLSLKKTIDLLNSLLDLVPHSVSFVAASLQDRN